VETSKTAHANLELDTVQLKKASLILRALNHKLRQDIIKFIHQNYRVTVSEIYKKMKLEQSVTSQHLGILRKTRCVNTERDGKFIFYSVNHKRLKEVQKFCNDLLS
jgi:DNA-binding transcriptional ArsR family regulator